MSELACVSQGRGLQPLWFDEAIDQTYRQCFRACDPPPAEQEILGAGRADGLNQAARLDKTIENAKFGGGNREKRVIRAKAQIAAERQRQSAANGIAAHRRDRRTIERDERLEAVLDSVAIVARRLLVPIDRFKLAD